MAKPAGPGHFPKSSEVSPAAGARHAAELDNEVRLPWREPPPWSGIFSVRSKRLAHPLIPALSKAESVHLLVILPLIIIIMMLVIVQLLMVLPLLIRHHHHL